MKYNNLKNILVPLDFSESSLNALETAIVIARQHSASILLLNVVDTRLMFGFSGVSYISEKTIERIAKVSAKMLASVVENVKQKHQLTCTALVKVGLVPLSIINAAFDNKSDLIVLGTHGVSGFRDLFIGTTAQEVVKIATCPVLTVPGNRKWTSFEKILFPVYEIAGTLGKYDLMHKIIGTGYSSLKIVMLAKPQATAGGELLSRLANELWQELSNREIKDPGNLVFCENDAAAVLKMSLSSQADMVVIGLSGNTTFKEFFIGPFEQHIVNHASMPVLSLRSALTSPDSQLVIRQIHESYPDQIPFAV